MKPLICMTLCAAFLPAQGVESVVFVAHRGGIVEGYPENTLPAFRRSATLGIDAIEVDLRATRDGEIVILHDETLDRTTNGSGKVGEFTSTELRRLDAGGGERIPTFEETLRVVAGTGVQLVLDIKESPMLDKAKVVRLIEKHHAILNVIVAPRNLDDLRAFQQLNANLRTLGLIRAPEDVGPFAAAGVHIIRLWPKWIDADPGLVKKVLQTGRPVWTTAGPAPRDELERLIRMGVTGIVTDLPEIVHEMRLARPQVQQQR